MPRHPPYALAILTLTSSLLLSKNIARLRRALSAPDLQLTADRSLLIANIGGGERDRTDDPLLAKQVLSQLSYTPI